MNSVGALADEVARWIVVTHPNFGLSTGSEGTSDFGCIFPDYLSVVAAHPPAAVFSVVVVGFFLRPRVDDLGRTCLGTGDREQILTVFLSKLSTPGPMGEVALLALKLLGPLLCIYSEIVRPLEWRDADFFAHDIVSLRHAGETPTFAG